MASPPRGRQGRPLHTRREDCSSNLLRRLPLSSNSIPEAPSASTHETPEEPHEPIGALEEVLEQLDLPKSPTSPPPMTEREASQAVTPTLLYPSDADERHTAPGELGEQRTKLTVPDLSFQFSLDAALDRLAESFPPEPYDEEPPLTDSGSDDEDDIAGEKESGETDETRAPSENGKFRLEWICTERLAFSRTVHIRDPWNHGRQVKFSGDGHKLEPGIGQQLIDEWQRLVSEIRAGDRGLLRRRGTLSTTSG
ncbi:hypothetical protein V5O48_013890 [Marasmius crinis-equi]|uniref:YTH domain-containing protein n=1 Tax=Marasmius crinis-equi TaxID=585013 RepID=A0ABR3EYV4_9AGAR